MNERYRLDKKTLETPETDPSSFEQKENDESIPTPESISFAFEKIFQGVEYEYLRGFKDDKGLYFEEREVRNEKGEVSIKFKRKGEFPDRIKSGTTIIYAESYSKGKHPEGETIAEYVDGE
jgi:hypothetical protein